MPVFKAEFTVTKSFPVQVFFEAADAEVAAEMARDMEQDDEAGEILSDECEEGDHQLDSVEMDGAPSEYQIQSVSTTRSIKRWCDQWVKDRAEEEAEEAS